MRKIIEGKANSKGMIGKSGVTHRGNSTQGRPYQDSTNSGLLEDIVRRRRQCSARRERLSHALAWRTGRAALARVSIPSSPLAQCASGCSHNFVPARSLFLSVTFRECISPSLPRARRALSRSALVSNGPPITVAMPLTELPRGLSTSRSSYRGDRHLPRGGEG